MSYHGYIPLVKAHLAALGRPASLLEVGIDRGVTLVPMVAFMARVLPAFLAVGIDVKVQEQVVLMLNNIDLGPRQLAFCIEGNSLEVLPKLVERGNKFDVILLDGDHNYHTVSRELALLEDLAVPGACVICDDYDGRWSADDMWYAERDGYQDVRVATQRTETDKHGVKAAVDEWLAAHPEWQMTKPVPGEPVVLRRT